MICKRIPAGEVRVGDVLVSTSRRTVNRRVNEIKKPQPGHPTVGPRGGRYRLTAAGAARMVILVTANEKPVLDRNSSVVVMREEDQS